MCIGINIHKLKYIDILYIGLYKRNIQNRILGRVGVGKSCNGFRNCSFREVCVAVCGGLKLVFSLFPSDDRGFAVSANCMFRFR